MIVHSITIQRKRVLVGLLLLLATTLIFVRNDSFLYRQTVAGIISVENSFSHEEDGPNDEQEKYYEQVLTVKILNGDYKGQEIVLRNEFSESGVNDERYHFGDQVFVSLRKNGTEGTISGKKRDTSFICMMGLFLVLLIGLNGKRGMLTLMSMMINVLIFLVALTWYGKGGKLTQSAFILVIVFNLITLLFASGFHKKTLVAIISSMVTTMVCYGIYEIVLGTSERLPYEMMDYVVNSSDLSDLFLTGVLMGSLGAVMDVSISIAAGVAEILCKKPDIQMSDLVRSIREMGYDIMGTMINVLFFSYMSSAVPILVIKIKNGYTLYHLINCQLIFEIIRFLMGAIGIVLAIPIAGLCSAVFLKKRIGKGED